MKKGPRHVLRENPGLGVASGCGVGTVRHLESQNPRMGVAQTGERLARDTFCARIRVWVSFREDKLVSCDTFCAGTRIWVSLRAVELVPCDTWNLKIREWVSPRRVNGSPATRFARESWFGCRFGRISWCCATPGNSKSANGCRTGLAGGPPRRKKRPGLQPEPGSSNSSIFTLRICR